MDSQITRQKGLHMPDQKLTENFVVGIVLILGTFSGLLLQIATEEKMKPWKLVVANAVLNGMFTAGVYALLMFIYSTMPIIYAVVISAGASSIGRSLFLRIIEWRIKQ